MSGKTVLLGAVLFALYAPLSVFAGPPYITDDQERVEYQHWEVNFAVDIRQTAGCLNMYSFPLVERLTTNSSNASDFIERHELISAGAQLRAQWAQISPANRTSKPVPSPNLPKSPIECWVLCGPAYAPIGQMRPILVTKTYTLRPALRWRRSVGRRTIFSPLLPIQANLARSEEDVLQPHPSVVTRVETWIINGMLIHVDLRDLYIVVECRAGSDQPGGPPAHFASARFRRADRCRPRLCD